MKFAIVDIETTGGHASSHGITEIAIVLHNGKEVEGKFSTLINPQQPIPPYIAAMTGISNQMVAKAPLFNEVAEPIFNLLNDRIFIAHNVNFDYSFIKYHLQAAGYNFTAKKLCTVRMSRKLLPGFKKYGLGNLCRELDIHIENRHRAGGDADATAKVFEIICNKHSLDAIHEFLLRENKDQFLPPNLPVRYVNKLPLQSGVYYFHDAKGKIIYVGKATCIKYRVTSHFTGLNTGKKRQDFLREIYSISCKTTSSEFTASVLESAEIKRLWPKYNVSQKNYEHKYAMYCYEDMKGYLRLVIDKKKKQLKPLISVSNKSEANSLMWKISKDYSIHPGLCFLDKSTTTFSDLPEVEWHNTQVKEAIISLQSSKQNYYLVDGDHFILMEEGSFYGMGQLAETQQQQPFERLKELAVPYAANEVIHNLVRRFAENNPGNVFVC